MNTVSTLKLALELLEKEDTTPEVKNLEILAQNYSKQIEANTILIQNLTKAKEEADLKLHIYNMSKEDLKKFIGNLLADFITEENIEVIVFEPPKTETSDVPASPVEPAPAQEVQESTAVDEASAEQESTSTNTSGDAQDEAVPVPSEAETVHVEEPVVEEVPVDERVVVEEAQEPVLEDPALAEEVPEVAGVDGGTEEVPAEPVSEEASSDAISTENVETPVVEETSVVAEGSVVADEPATTEETQPELDLEVPTENIEEAPEPEAPVETVEVAEPTEVVDGGGESATSEGSTESDGEVLEVVSEGASETPVVEKTIEVPTLASGLVSFAPFSHRLDVTQKDKGVVLPANNFEYRITQGLDPKAYKSFEYGFVDVPPYIGPTLDAATIIAQDHVSSDTNPVIMYASTSGASQIIGGGKVPDSKYADAKWSVQAVLPKAVKGICATPIKLTSGPSFTHSRGLSFEVAINAIGGDEPRIEVVYSDGNLKKVITTLYGDWSGKENVWAIDCKPSSGYVDVTRDGVSIGTISIDDDLNGAEWIDTYTYPAHELYMPKNIPFNAEMPQVSMILKGRGLEV